jgi:hypothetical protein
MRRFFHIACFIFLCAGASFAQQRDYSKFDLTGAFTVVRLDDSEKLYGLTAAPAYNFTKHLAVEGDLTYTSKSEFGTRLDLTTYMGGLRYTFRPSKLQPFVHGMVGGTHLSVSRFRDNGLAAKVGGGLDIVATKHIAVRVVQLDYYPIHFSGGSVSNNVAFTFGVRVN